MDSTQVLINSLMSANSVEELRNRLIPLLTAISASGPSGGISDIESSTLDVSIADGVATVDGIGGEFVPVPSNATESATIDIINGFYYRVGNFVTMVFGLDVQIGLGQLSTTFNFSLPIASNFTNSRQMILTCNQPENLVFLIGSSNATENKGSITIVGNMLDVEIKSLQISATYEVL